MNEERKTFQIAINISGITNEQAKEVSALVRGIGKDLGYAVGGQVTRPSVNNEFVNEQTYILIGEEDDGTLHTILNRATSVDEARGKMMSSYPHITSTQIEMTLDEYLDNYFEEVDAINATDLFLL